MKNMKLEFKMNGHACNYYTACIYLLFMQMCCYLSFEQAKREIKLRSYWLVHKPGIGFFWKRFEIIFLNPIFPLINIV